MWSPHFLLYFRLAAAKWAFQPLISCKILLSFINLVIFELFSQQGAAAHQVEPTTFSATRIAACQQRILKLLGFSMMLVGTNFNHRIDMRPAILIMNVSFSFKRSVSSPHLLFFSSFLKRFETETLLRRKKLFLLIPVPHKETSR